MTEPDAPDDAEVELPELPDDVEVETEVPDPEGDKDDDAS